MNWENKIGMRKVTKVRSIKVDLSLISQFLKLSFFTFFFLFPLSITLYGGKNTIISQKLTFNKGWRFHKGDISFPVITGQGMTYQSAKAGQSWGAAAPEYDDTDWRLLNLPHDWAVENPFDSTANIAQGYRHRGIGWYRRSFKLSEYDKGKYIELQFDGIATHATIWVNGSILHRNFCGYTSMYIDITPYAKYGDKMNTIAIRVDANEQEGWWYEGAGIYRSTWIVKRSPLHIVTDGIYANPVKSNKPGKWIIPVEVTLQNIAKKQEHAALELTLFDSKGKLVSMVKKNTKVNELEQTIENIILQVDSPMLWSPDHPVLYKVQTRLLNDSVLLDEQNVSCGFRSIRFDSKTGFYLNDVNMKIKGVCNHQDHAGVGVAIPDGIWEFRLRLLKQMGANAYRVAHNPPSKEFLNICDSLGIMVLNENRHFNTSPEYIRQLEWLVRRDRNHPSVILWSVFNEEPMQATENGFEMARRMVKVVKKLDITRPVTAAMNGGFFSPLNVGHAVDLVGANYQLKDYDRVHSDFPEMPFMSSEDGSAFMTRGEYRTDFKQNIISSYDTESARWGATHRKSWKEIATRPFMAGCFYWTGFDYRGEPTPLTWPSASSFFGILDLCGFPKSAYYIRQAQWIEKKTILELIPHWSWPVDSVGKPIKVMVMSNTDSVLLKLNGKIIGGQRVDRFEMNSWYVPFKPGKLEVIAFKNNKKVAVKAVETTGKPKAIKITPYRVAMKGNGKDAMPLTVEVVDGRGRTVPTANNLINFSVNGPLIGIGVGNGNPNSHESEKEMKRSLFNGLAQLIVQTNEKAGKGVVTATSPGLIPASITIQVDSVNVEPFMPFEKSEILLDKWRVSPFSETKPDPNQKLADNDMNTWEPIGIGTLLNPVNESYFIMRTLFRSYKSQRNEGGTIEFKKVAGKAEFWFDGQLIGEKKTVETEDVLLKLPKAPWACEVRVMFRCKSGERAGLFGSVIAR